PALPPGHYLRLRVADSGCGMEKSVMERIFDPFFTTKGPGEGSGMGLAVAHGIVKSHGGAIRVDSMVGRGSTFTIFLPAMTGEPPPAVPRPKRSVTPAGGGENILFVDDEEVLVSMTRQFMEELGYMFTGETSSPAALARFGQNPYLFDLVITDQTMPQLSGLEMAEAMIKLRPDLPIILYTGYSEKVNQERAMEVGIKAFLMKPVSASKLAETVRAVLDGETEICSLPDHETPPVVDSQNQ
ncbi:MAG: response regulator, partial [Desulfobulbaceae bacterium]|nr:response regulator [Desulfobulbaceae bacterium]